MPISDNIKAISDRVVAEREAANLDPTKGTPLADEIRSKAIKAVLGGVAEREEYMKLYVSPGNPAELAQLMPTADPPDDKKQIARAYLISNGVCGSGSTRFLLDNVTVDLN